MTFLWKSTFLRLFYQKRGGGELEFYTIASGSSGNSTYIGSQHTRILIDAGVSGKRITDSLESLGLQGEQIDALFITHEHTDHIKGAGVFSRKFHVPIYATEETWHNMESSLGKIAPHNKRFVYPDEMCIINDLCIRPFSIPHDTPNPVGYSVFAEQKKVTVATDIGHITENLKENITDSDVLLLEANHDERLVEQGKYPWSLKQRILGENGHLSNKNAGKLLTEILTGKTQYIFLGHLSQENNRPYLAYETVQDILEQNQIKLGGRLKMDMAARYSNGVKVEI